MQVQVLAIGDPTLDSYLSIHEAHIALALDRDSRQLCIVYADKIPVDAHLQTAGGNAVNAARALARLGIPVAIYGIVGGDPAGESVARSLVDGGVDVRWLAVDPTSSTNATTALLFQGERTLFVWHEARAYRLPAAAVAPCVYLTSVGPRGPAVDQLHEDVCRAVDAAGARLFFSPGTHQLRMGSAALAPLLRRTETLLLNREEAAELTGLPADDVPALLCALHELGPATVAVTDGPDGSWAFDGGRVLHCGTVAVRVVDRTGAGDAYSAAFTGARLAGLPVAEAMLWGTIEAEGVVGALGPAAGLLTRDQVAARLARDGNAHRVTVGSSDRAGVRRGRRRPGDPDPSAGTRSRTLTR